MNIENMVDENDAFLMETKEYNYFYAVIADLKDKGKYYYKVNKNTGEITEINEDEVIDYINNKEKEIIHRCPCMKIENGHLRSLIERKQK